MAKAPTKAVKGSKPDSILEVPAHMPPKKFQAPTLGPNTTPEMLVDELGLIKAWASYYKAAEEFHKEALKARTAKERTRVKNPISTFQGDKFEATFSNRSRTGLNTEAIRNEMGDEWVSDHSSTTDYVEIRTKEI